MKFSKFCFDAGHGAWNRKRGKYDTGAVRAGVEEATIALAYANTMRDIMRDRGVPCIRSRRDAQDPAPVQRRDDVALAYGCDCMISFHCNDSDNPKVSGSEVFFRGEEDRALAEKLSFVVSSVYGIKDRGARTEKESQHRALAIMEFRNCWLIELGFLSNSRDRELMQDANLRLRVCTDISDLLLK